MTIAFVHHNKAFLPALYNYPLFFSRYNVKCQVVTKQELRMIDRQIEWFFMGTDLSERSANICKIHEYISPSTPPFRLIKDLYKKKFNTRPDIRIFKNEYVKNRFNFFDNTPSFYQDIGIPTDWITGASGGEKKEYDFIYVGELSKKREPEHLIDLFLRPDMLNHTLLLLSKDYSYLQSKYSNHTNIIFKGPVDKAKVKSYLQKSRFGINYIPDREPFNELTSTKFLEYAAAKIPIITTNYKWVRDFEKKYGGRYFYLNDDFSNFSWEAVNEFKYSFPDLTEWTWESQIRKSGVLNFLSSRFPDINW